MAAVAHGHGLSARLEGPAAADQEGLFAVAMTVQEIEELIHAGLPDAQVTIEDLAGDGNHYRAHVVAPGFRGKSRVQQHQMVYRTLGERMGGALHALALTTAAPD